MKRIFLLWTLTIIVTLGLRAEAASAYSFEDYINEEYHVTDQSILASTYYVVASKPQTLEEGFAYLKSGGETLERSRVFLAMGTLLSAYPTDKYNADIKEYVEDVESSYSHYSDIIRTYTALAKIGTEQTLEMLKERATYEFWEERRMPSLISSDPDHGHDHYADNAQSTAISRLGRHQSSEAKAFLEELQENPRYVHDPILKENDSLRIGLEAATEEGIAYRQKQINDALALKKSIFEADAAIENIEEPIARIRAVSSAEETAEVIEQVTEPEQATEGFAEVVVAEPIEEDVEQSSNWWLWLVGALVVVGGLGLVLRRKN